MNDAIKDMFSPEPLLNCQKLYYMTLERFAGKNIVFHWNYTGTQWQPPNEATYKAHTHIINSGCLDTRKSYVDKIFTKVYGYSSAARALIAIEKNESTNGVKDCRLSFNHSNPDCFYQKILFSGPDFDEYRITVMGFIPVIIMIKHKTVNLCDIIGTVNGYEFTDQVPDKIEQFCKAYPLEYGEIDGCYFNGCFWIYDVNPTPGDAAFHRMPSDQSRYYQEIYKEKLYQWLTCISS